MGDPPLNHRQNAQAQAQARTNKQNARAISHHRPSSIGRKPSCVCPSSEGSRQNPDTRHDNSLAQLHSQPYSISSSNMLLTLFAIDRSTDSTASFCLQAATLPPKDRRERKRTHLRFRSHADGLASLEHPSIPVATSGPAQSIPTLLDYRQKDPFFAAPYGEAGALDLARDKNSQSHLRLARPPPGLDAHARTKACWQYILVCAQM